MTIEENKGQAIRLARQTRKRKLTNRLINQQKSIDGQYEGHPLKVKQKAAEKAEQEAEATKELFIKQTQRERETSA